MHLIIIKVKGMLKQNIVFSFSDKSVRPMGDINIKFYFCSIILLIVEKTLIK